MSVNKISNLELVDRDESDSDGFKTTVKPKDFEIFRYVLLDEEAMNYEFNFEESYSFNW